VREREGGGGRGREEERQRDTERHRETQRERQTDRKTDRQTDRQTEIERKRFGCMILCFGGVCTYLYVISDFSETCATPAVVSSVCV